MAKVNNKFFIIRIPETLKTLFNLYCEDKGYDASSRVRSYMLRDIEKWKEDKLKEKRNQRDSI